MARYIDADALREKVFYHADTMNHAGNHEQAKAFNYCLCMIDDMPTADVVEVKQGVWSLNIDDWFGDCYKCSACGEEFVLNEETPKDYGYNYCPNCGAKMKGEENVF